MEHTHDKDGACDTLDGCTLGLNEQATIIEDCGCTHSPCPCDEADCSYYGAICNLCAMHAAAPALLSALEEAGKGFARMLDNMPYLFPINGRSENMTDEQRRWRDTVTAMKQAARAAIKQAKGDERIHDGRCGESGCSVCGGE